MRKEFAAVLIAIFAVALVLGCTGGGDKEDTGAGKGYTLNVNPTSVVPGGIVTMDLRLSNPFERVMSNIKVTTPEISYDVSGQIESDGTEISPGQSYPALLTMEIPGNAFGDISNKNIKVCFNYVTDYYYDVAKKTKTGTEDFSISQGQTSGPIKVSQTGLDSLYVENNKATGSLAITNDWQGSIERINSITATVPSGLSSIELKVGSSCSDDSTSEAQLKDCSIFENKGAIASGLTVINTLNSDSDVTGVTRVQGTVNLDYCYKVPVPTIKIQSVPQ